MRVLAIDPGPVKSAMVIWDGDRVCTKHHWDNDEMLHFITDLDHDCDEMAIEMIASFGMAVGKEVFETVYWIGRFYQAWIGGFNDVKRPFPTRVFRMEVKMHLCHSARAKDGNVRQALVDRFGGKDAAIGKKKSPGVLYGISGDCWSALAVAVTWMDKQAA